MTSQSRDNVQEVVVSYIQSIKPDAISTNANASQLKIYRILDSVDMLAFITHLEAVFSIQITDADVLAKNFETVGLLTEFIRRKLAERPIVIDG
jgi:acyl carrier protein